jgi:cysteine sulfinate desulfinase/cysteine desulfurase-like protein
MNANAARAPKTCQASPRWRGGAVAAENREQERRASRRARPPRTGVLARIPHAAVNAAGAERAANTANLRFEGLEGEALVIALDLAGFAVDGRRLFLGRGVALARAARHGPRAPKRARQPRFSLGRGNDEAQVDALVDALEPRSPGCES